MKNTPQVLATLLLSVLAALFCSACSSIDTPKGDSEGYGSVRFVKSGSDPDLERPGDTVAVNQAVREAISSEFRKNGMTVGEPSADLIVAFMILRQGGTSTTMNMDYFGHGRDPDAILERAHERGVIENKNPDPTDTGAVLIDVLDTRTNELVFRNFAKRSVIDGISEDARKQRINSAVAEALAPFFR